MSASLHRLKISICRSCRTLKARTPARNRWLGQALPMGNLHTVSRLVSVAQKQAR